jgi:histidinol-phosphate aminotransferase
MSKYWSEITKKISPYVPGEQPKDKMYIKLNTNENPYPPSPKALEAIKAAADSDLRLYSDPDGEDLREALSEYYGFPKEQIFVGNGSDEVLAFSFMTFFNPGKKILYPDISYSFYDVYSKLFNIDYEHVLLKEDFSIPVEEFLKENGGVIFPNPNAPTGKYLSSTDVKKIIENNLDGVVIVDEAYIDFGGESALKYVNEYPNLLVIQTFSKSRSLAGLRVGFAIGQKDLIEGLNRVKNSINSYTLDRLAIAGGASSVKDKEYFKENVQKVITTRERVSRELRNAGFNVIESKANFIFISHTKCKAEYIFGELKKRGVLVRYFKKQRIDNYLRVSIGSDEEMDVFLKEIKEIIN